VGDSCHVIARKELTVPLPLVANALAKVTGRLAIDVTRELRNRVGILASSLNTEQARAFVTLLGQTGVPAFVLPEHEFVRFPPPVFLETARFADDALDVADLRDQNNRPLGAVNLPYNDIVFLATARVRSITETRETVPDSGPAIQPRFLSPGLGFGATFGLDFDSEPHHTTRTRQHYQYANYLDLFAVEPAHHVRLNAATFNFIQTGMKMKPTSILNLAQFAATLSARCQHAQIDPSIRHILDGNPQTNLTCKSLDAYQDYLDWRIQLLYHPPKT